METARLYDSKILILRTSVARIEVGCAILGNDTKLIAGAVDRVALSRGFFRIHQEAAPEKAVQKTQHLSFPLTFLRRLARLSRKRRRLCIEHWGAGDWLGWTCSSRMMDRSS